MQLDSSGNLGLGVTPSAWNGTLKSIDINTGGGLTASTVGFSLTANAYFNGANWVYKNTSYATYYEGNNGGVGKHAWFTAPSGTAGNAISFTQAMTLDNSGNLLVGTTSAYNSSKVTVSSTANNGIASTQATTGGYCFVSNALINTATYYHASFLENGTQRGSITSNGTITSYNTTSDVRLKENIIDAPSGNIDDVKIRSFDWKSNGSHQEYGVVAQELLEVAPYAVTIGQDEEKIMQVDYSKLVPMMIKEIQDLKAEVNQLKQKLGV
jgi:hypothetical protein